MPVSLAPNMHRILVFSNRRAYSNASWLDIKYFFISHGNYRQYLNFKLVINLKIREINFNVL